ncbi:uncharacterized protein LOC132600105 [Lycium barbarum]|uniref:uncharacterized protein LOC132600105 n=1 Tax=Lycium barbarum TaxID=112863 RepID=UPI00293E607C|nr:uncharacterized protein LOC132600105 [Lycium barbarum]
MNKYHPRLLHSYPGLLLFGDHVFPYTFFVFNPITQEEITIKHTLGAGSICGFYLCPLTRELKILYAKVRSRGCQYLIYTIWSQTWRRIRSPALNSIPTYLSPAIVNGAMHWIMDREFGEEDGIPPCSIAILMFRLDTEELSHMPHLGTQRSSRQSRECRTHETMSLLVKEEHLSFCQLRIHEKAMDIWILEDCEMWAWIRSYRVNLDLDVNVFPYHSPSAYCESELIHWGMAQFVKPSSIHDGELLICWSLRGLFLYDLDGNTVRRIEPQGRSSTLTPFTCMPYTKSLRHIV